MNEILEIKSSSVVKFRRVSEQISTPKRNQKFIKNR
jgi:hypothetical protein